jgi:hypothetical protein
MAKEHLIKPTKTMLVTYVQVRSLPGTQEEQRVSHCVSDAGCSGLFAASITVARHSRLMGKIGGMGATSGSAVGSAIDSIFSVISPAFVHSRTLV